MSGRKELAGWFMLAMMVALPLVSGAESQGQQTVETGVGASKPPLYKITANLVDDDLVIQGNACIGESCSSTDDDYPVLKLKGSQPNILFDDIALPEGPPSSDNDWAVFINPFDAAQFSIVDFTGQRIPFSIMGGAPDHSLFVSGNGDVGLGTSTPAEKLHVFEDVDANTFLLVENPNTGASSAGILRAKSNTAIVNLIAHGSGRTISRFGQTLAGWTEMLQASGNGLILGTFVDKPLILGTNSTNRMQIGGTGGVTVYGNFTATGTKSFAVVDPDDAHQAIYYAALEGPEAGTYFRGTAKTSGGEAVIQLPDYFARLTEPERMTVQLTPLGTWGQLYVAEKTPSRLVVRVPPGSADVEFDYLVQGIRKGYLDYQVKRPNTLPE
jgi:hypothetical protein